MPKGLIEVQGRPWIDRQIESLKRAGAGKIIVVLGHHRDAYERVLKAHNIETVINPDPDRGPFSSLQAGLEMLGTEAKAAWVLPVDVPCPSRAVWESLEQEASVRSTDATLPVHLGRGGHPVRLSLEFSRRLLGVSPEASEARLDHQIHQLPAGQVARVEVSDAKVLANLNTADDFARHAG
jgi:CTP:molybdopterin cytidylyltransferase MocA